MCLPARAAFQSTVHHTLRHLELECVKDMTSTQYRYTSLSSESSFRLFRIVKPCSPVESNSLDIHLFEADFEDPPAFEAVSYAWGEGLSTSIILCNGQQLPVTTNVEAILRRLGQTESVGTFWIDSICINQYSVAEKNIQVPRMRYIYSQARLVWIWLGEGIDEIETALAWLSGLSEIFSKPKWPYEHLADYRKSCELFKSMSGQSNESRC
jgi:hypothetical protein